MSAVDMRMLAGPHAHAGASVRVADLFRYPISSLGGERLDRLHLSADGVEGDRRYGLFDRETGRHIYPARDARWNAAPLLHSRLVENRLDISEDGLRWQDAFDDDAENLLARRLGLPVDLRAYDDGVRPRYTVAPIHLLSLQSMAKLRERLPESLIDERRFRPNIVVDWSDNDSDIPEYALLGREFSLGGVRLRGTVPCGRCGFTILPIAELPEDAEILRTLLREYERNFGIYCEVLTSGPVGKGDSLTMADLSA